MPVWEPGEFSSRQWPDWSFWWEGRPGRGGFGRGRVAGLVVNVLAMLALAPRILDFAGARHGLAITSVLIGTSLCYGLAVPLAVWFGPAMPHGRRVVVVVVVFALGIAPALLLGSPVYLTDSTFAIAAAIMLLPLRYSVLLGAATAAVQIAWMRLGTGDVNWGAVATLLGVTAALGMAFALLFTIGHLRAARDQVRLLAVTQERERVARDLHDILGHSLSTMTIKTGLARRMLESTGDVEHATAEIRELEGLTRQALSDVRATVSDYRTVTLSTEIAGARVALRAAGVRADMPAAVDDVDPAFREVFGYVVREAVTNVIRHSGAANCQVRLGRNWVSISDDGTTAVPGTPGNGLTGLGERLVAVSGTVEHGPRPDGGFRVTASGPAPQSTDVRTDAVEAGPTT